MASPSADTTQVRDLLTECDIGDRVLAQNAPAWNGRRAPQAFSPPGHAEGTPAWLFSPLFEGEEFVAWKRID